jgi:hypothetical protein
MKNKEQLREYATWTLITVYRMLFCMWMFFPISQALLTYLYWPGYITKIGAFELAIFIIYSNIATLTFYYVGFIYDHKLNKWGMK